MKSSKLFCDEVHVVHLSLTSTHETVHMSLCPRLAASGHMLLSDLKLDLTKAILSSPAESGIARQELGPASLQAFITRDHRSTSLSNARNQWNA